MDFLTDTYKQYDLIYTSDNLLQRSGDHYTPFERKCYYDIEKSILAFGDIYNEGEIISLNSSTFAKLENQYILDIRQPGNGFPVCNKGDAYGGHQKIFSQ